MGKRILLCIYAELQAIRELLQRCDNSYVCADKAIEALAATTHDRLQSTPGQFGMPPKEAEAREDRPD